MRREFVDVTMTCDTSILASGDVITDTAQVLASAGASKRGVIRSVVVNDEDDQGQALDVVFLAANRSLGTKNAAPNISDADARDRLGIVAVAAADFLDLGGVRVATKPALEIPVSTDALYVSLVCRGGTPTYTANGLRLRIGIEHDG